MAQDDGAQNSVDVDIEDEPNAAPVSETPAKAAVAPRGGAIGGVFFFLLMIVAVAAVVAGAGAAWRYGATPSPDGRIASQEALAELRTELDALRAAVDARATGADDASERVADLTERLASAEQALEAMNADTAPSSDWEALVARLDALERGGTTQSAALDRRLAALEDQAAGVAPDDSGRTGRIAALETGLETLGSDLDALAEAISLEDALAEDLTSVRADLEALAEAISLDDALSDEVAQFRADVMETQAAQDSAIQAARDRAAVALTDLASLKETIVALEASIAALRADGVGSAAQTDALSLERARAAEANVDALAADVERLREELSTLRADQEARADAAGEEADAAMRARTALALVEAFRASSAFEAAFDAYAALAPGDDALDALRPYRTAGAPPPRALGEVFKAVARTALAADRQATSEGPVDRALAGVRDLVTVRPVGPGVSGDDLKSRLARIETAALDGDLDEALAEAQLIEGPASEEDSFKQWMTSARRLQDARNAADDLATRARGWLDADAPTR